MTHTDGDEDTGPIPLESSTTAVQYEDENTSQHSVRPH